MGEGLAVEERPLAGDLLEAQVVGRRSAGRSRRSRFRSAIRGLMLPVASQSRARISYFSLVEVLLALVESGVLAQLPPE